MNSATMLIHCKPCLGRAGGTFKRGQRTKVNYMIRGSFAAADHIHRDQMWPRPKYTVCLLLAENLACLETDHERRSCRCWC